VEDILEDMFLPSVFEIFEGVMIFVKVPGVELVTLTAIEQEREAAIEPPDQINCVPRAGAVRVPPTQ